MRPNTPPQASTTIHTARPRRWRAMISSASAVVLLATGLLAGAATPAHAATPACDNSAWVMGSYPGNTPGTRLNAIYDMPTKYYGGGRNEWKCSLRYGSTGYAVRRLQTTLNDCHVNTTKTWLNVDGQFGSRTRNALIAVQRAYGISADGGYGPQTAGTIAHPVYPSDNRGWRCGTYIP